MDIEATANKSVYTVSGGASDERRLLLRLQKFSSEILARMFVPGRLVQAGQALESIPNLFEIFKQASSTYSSADYASAFQIFSDLSVLAEKEGPGLGRSSKINAAAAATASETYSETVSLLHGLFTVNRLYGIPLWNYSLALYKTNHIDDAYKAFSLWLSRAPLSRASTGHLIAACLATLCQDNAGASQHLNSALKTSRSAVMSAVYSSATRFAIQKAIPPLTGSQRSKEKSGQSSPQGPLLTDETIAALRLILIPKRPDRMPGLSSQISTADMDNYSRAVEITAEGDFRQSLELLLSIQQRYGSVLLLNCSIAAVQLLLGQIQPALNQLVAAQESGVKLPGSALWNLACATFQAGDYRNALRALRACSETEYRTRASLWTAINILSPTPQPAISPTVATSQPQSAASEIGSDIDALLALLPAKRLARNYWPDRARIPFKDRSTIRKLLDAVNSAPPAEALGMLLPVIRQFPDSYSLRAHAATTALLAGDSQTALQCFKHAQSLRTLDRISRIDYARLSVQAGDIAGAVRILEDGIKNLSINRQEFWLALAICRSMSDIGDASAAAAMALSCANDQKSKEHVRQLLARFKIVPARSASAEVPAVSIAKKALSILEVGKVADAARILVEDRTSVLQKVLEIGRQVFEPQFFERPLRIWNRDVARDFTAAVEFYRARRFREAASRFTSLIENIRSSSSLYINASAAYIKSSDPKRARGLARKALTASTSPESRWRAAYNLALAFREIGDIQAAIQALQRPELRTRREIHALRAAICINDKKSFQSLVQSLDYLRADARLPSNDLLLVLAWSRLQLEPPEVIQATEDLKSVTRNVEKANLQPPAEVTYTSQLKTAVDFLRRNDSLANTRSYLEMVIQTRVRERTMYQATDISKKEVESNLAVELMARRFLVETLESQNDSFDAIQTLDEAESVLAENTGRLPASLFSLNWAELAKLARRMGLSWSLLRYCAEGLKADSGNSILDSLQAEAKSLTTPELERTLIDETRSLRYIADSGVSPAQTARDLEAQFSSCRALESSIPLLAGALRNLFCAIDDHIAHEVSIAQLSDRVTLLARMTLPPNAAKEVDLLVAGTVRMYVGPEGQVPLDVSIVDDAIWPRIDETEGCCLLALTSSTDLPDVSLTDSASGRRIWSGTISNSRTEYVRWIAERDEGFVPGDEIDVPLAVQISKGSESLRVHNSLSVSVAASEPKWPNYHLGALSPEEILSDNLYGRSDLIQKLVSSLGQVKGHATYLVEAPRQMGKTSLLNFVKYKVPDHVLAVYINCELEWSRDNPNNPWSLFVRFVTKEAGHEIPDATAQDLIDAVKRMCQVEGKKYALLMLDEFHNVLERSSSPNAILSVFREFHNNASNQISLLLADRLTLEELELKCPHDYWAQLSVKALGPLDKEATTTAVIEPTVGSDVTFLKETLERVYYWTGGYPYHVQRVAMMIAEGMYGGPWLTAVPADVDCVVDEILLDDRLFQTGLCRPDRLDDVLEQAIGALLEWRDLHVFLATLRLDPEWGQVVVSWEPRMEDILINYGDPKGLLKRLAGVGVLREWKGRFEFFSPLLESWLIKMRSNRIGLRIPKNNGWLLGDAAQTPRDGTAWQYLDKELIRKCEMNRVVPPLKSQATAPSDWEALVRTVNDEEEFRTFLDAAFRLFIDHRDNKQALLNYPWLLLAYHRLRLVRNYFVHGNSDGRSAAVLDAWQQIRIRALGGQKKEDPVLAVEWQSVQRTLLQLLYSGIRNAIALTN